jgi:Leucine-rich repeat (LRR) protein
VLDAAGNKISKVDAVTALTGLTSLTLSRNPLQLSCSKVRQFEMQVCRLTGYSYCCSTIWALHPSLGLNLLQLSCSKVRQRGSAILQDCTAAEQRQQAV